MQWNIGGWLGGQLGGTIWMLIAGVLAFRVDATSAVIVIVLFLIANAIGLAIWRSRGRLSAYAGIQLFLPVLGAAGVAAVYVLERAQAFEAIQVGARASARSTYLIIVVVVAALMLTFYLRFGRKPGK